MLDLLDANDYHLPELITFLRYSTYLFFNSGYGTYLLQEGY